MRPTTVAGVAEAVGGSLRSSGTGADAGRAGAAAVGGVSVDSRRAGPGDVFFAIRGERLDGHAFVEDAFAHGAVAAVVAPGRGRWIGPVVEVPDPGASLLALAARERDRMTATVVGITGSTGKTCTKDFTAAALGASLRVAASPASFNNEVGLPLTLLGAPEELDVVVCEMGARGVGHIRALCEVARPSVGVVTNVGVAHLGLFGSREAIARAKGELPAAIPAGGAVVLNADDPVVRGYAALTAAACVLFGDAADAIVRAERVEVDGSTGRASFDLVTPGGTARVRLPVAGAHMVPNALAAAGVAWALDVPVEAAAAGLEAAGTSASRMEMFETPEGLTVVDDAYNANPTSMAAGLRAAATLTVAGRRIAVIGEMAELGEITPVEHERVGRLVAELGFDALVTVGPAAAETARGAERAGMPGGRIRTCDDTTQALEAVRDVGRPGDLVFVKASLAAGLQSVAAALREPDAVDAARVVVGRDGGAA